MSHFAQVSLKCRLDLLRATLDAMGLMYEEFPQGKLLRCNPSWKQEVPAAHLIVTPESLMARSGKNQPFPSMDLGFIRQEDGSYVPVLDEYVMRGKNRYFAQQFALKYSELAAESKGFQVVRDENGEPIVTQGESGKVRLQLRPIARTTVRR
jgi:hypothetical protein